MQACRDVINRVSTSDGTAYGIAPRDAGTPPRTPWHGTMRRTASDAIKMTEGRR